MVWGRWLTIMLVDLRVRLGPLQEALKINISDGLGEVLARMLKVIIDNLWALLEALKTIDFRWSGGGSWPEC